MLQNQAYCCILFNIHGEKFHVFHGLLHDHEIILVNDACEFYESSDNHKSFFNVLNNAHKILKYSYIASYMHVPYK